MYVPMAEGTKVTILAFGDPGGLVPTSVINLAAAGQMKLRLEMYKQHFVDRRAPDGSALEGNWPDDERVCSFKTDGEEEAPAVRADQPGRSTAMAVTSRDNTPASKERIRLEMYKIKLETNRQKYGSNEEKEEDGGGGKNASRSSRLAGNFSATFLNLANKKKALKRGAAKMRQALGCFFALMGVGMLGYINTRASQLSKVCEEELGACVWGRIEPKLYVRARRARGSETIARERSDPEGAKRARRSKASAMERSEREGWKRARGSEASVRERRSEGGVCWC